MCLTEFFSECETLHDALVHQGLFCRAIGDQFGALGLELILFQDNEKPYLLFFYSNIMREKVRRGSVVSAFLRLPYLQVQACSCGLIHNVASMFEGRELAE